jgi:SAM-dependent methyltransferase
MKVLELGCGNVKRVNSVCVDYYNVNNADVVWDLNKFPWPFKDNEFDEIQAHHVIEHLVDFLSVMKEIWRISKKGAKVIIRVPHCSSMGAWTNPTHKQAFGIGSFNYLTPNSTEPYTKNERFLIKKATLSWKGECKVIPLFLKKAMDELINSRPTMFESHFVYFLGGFNEIYFELEVVK